MPKLLASTDRYGERFTVADHDGVSVEEPISNQALKLPTGKRDALVTEDAVNREAAR